MIRTWAADVSALWTEDIYRKYYMQVPEERKKKADALAMQKDKALSVGVWILFQEMRKAYHLKEDVLFNLSHSGNYVLCSVCEKRAEEEAAASRLGCDLEKIAEPRPGVAKRFFCESEYKNVLENTDMFYRCWVLKESYLKATRMGMKLGMNTFEIAFSNQDEPYLKKYPDKFPETCYFKEYKIEGLPYRIAVCSDSREFDFEIKMIVLK